MTAAQCTESSPRSRSFVRESPPENEHDAINETATMSSYGPREDPSIAPTLISRPVKFLQLSPPARNIKNAQTQTLEPSYRHPLPPTEPEVSRRTKTGVHSKRRESHRIHFGRFAEQLRQHQYFENKRYLLEQRKRVLQRTITLSARLHRASSWVGDGLVEISQQSDTTCFARVRDHFQNLVELSYSQWDRELYALDPLGKTTTLTSETAGSSDVLSKLSNSAQSDLFELLYYLRSNHRFLVERFKVLTNSQIVSLWNPPRFQRPSESQYGSFSQNRGRLPHQRILSYSKSLEDYASSLERSNPLSFLLFNIYGTSQLSTDAENQLRLSTWSSVCAELMQTSERAYQALIIQLLDQFASIYEWRARDSVEMFLMDVLQRGSFLLDNHAEHNTTPRFPGYDSMRTQQEREFFDTAVQDLFDIFMKHDGGFPTGALQLASAMLSKFSAEQQKDFRGVFFYKWFVDHFLRSAIQYPENEDMLLKFHVSNSARQRILCQLWNTIQDRTYDVYNELRVRSLDPYFKICVESMVGRVDSEESINPYIRSSGSASDTENYCEGSITVSASEIVHTLEALSPQATYGVGSIDQLLEGPPALAASRGQYADANKRFDRLRSDLILLLEPGSSAVDVHPCQERWLQVDIDATGKLKSPQPKDSHTDFLSAVEHSNLDYAQRGAIRLFRDRFSESTAFNSTSYRSDLLKSPCLEALFSEMSDYSSAKLDPISFTYWNKAIDTLHERYPLSKFIQDDSAVLQEMLTFSERAQVKSKESCSQIELQLSVMENTCMKIRSKINRCMDHFDSLRLKIWYSVDVMLSRQYDDAKNIAKALNNMAMAASRNIKSSGSSFTGSRPMSPRSTTSSIFEQTYEGIMNMMKASSTQGGPKKLADKQIELTKNWLRQTDTENFCKGEERIHRFCMEVWTISRGLVGETLPENPILWSSCLFSQERSMFDAPFLGWGNTPVSAPASTRPASTRPASVFSDTMSFSNRSSRPGLRSAESLRMALLEDRRSTGSSRIYRDCLPTELASSIGSLSRAHSATTAESINSAYTPLTSNTLPLTPSATTHSRSKSVFNDLALGRFTEMTSGKTKFLEKVYQVLICLLLSDLGCAVWSLGSETDAMLDSSRSTLVVEARLKQRMMAEALTNRSRSLRDRQSSSLRPRRKSLSTFTAVDRPSSDLSAAATSAEQQDGYDYMIDDRLVGLSELLSKLSQQVDPVEKLTTVEEFYDLSLTSLRDRIPTLDHETNNQRAVYDAQRRGSLDEEMSKLRLQQHSETEWHRYETVQTTRSDVAQDIIQHLKSDLAKLRPRTLFRDLQYISAFVPAEHTDNTTRGKALLQLGLAALAYKDEVCRSMVDAADKMLLATQNPYSQQPLMSKVTEFWMSAAREGNSVAQRELASLYLSRPELLPVMSLPLSVSSQVFKTDMLWHERNFRNPNTQALCLALHWMQQASANGDRLAKQKLEERKDRNFIR